MEKEQTVENHYTINDLIERLDQSLERSGLSGKALTWQELAPIDQFHVRGEEASRELAEGLNLKPGATVLDAGCGLGGPARYLAAEYGCRVTGIDLSQSFIEAAQKLTERTGLADSVTFIQGDALNLPFPNESFDFAWTQHVAMNIADRKGFYENIRRVLKPGSKLAIYDVVAGSGEPLYFPVPWARDPANSFLLTADAMIDLLTELNFTEISRADKTAAGLEWFKAQSLQLSSDQPQPGIQVVMGPDFKGMAANLARNFREGRAELCQVIMQNVD